MEQEFISRNEHDEFVKRMEAEHSRQNHRIGDLEDTVKQIGDLTVAVGKLATSMEQMLNEQQTQGKRLEDLESRDGEMWRKITSHVLTAVAGAIICFVMAKIGI